MIPGIPLYFATAYAMNGTHWVFLAESHMGRPDQIEGNPDHPASLGPSRHLGAGFGSRFV
jgi:molybdopterin-containing oxidoreductase family iron-sulfur binding subunit